MSRKHETLFLKMDRARKFRKIKELFGRTQAYEALQRYEEAYKDATEVFK